MPTGVIVVGTASSEEGIFPRHAVQGRTKCEIGFHKARAPIGISSNTLICFKHAYSPPACRKAPTGLFFLPYKLQQPAIKKTVSLPMGKICFDMPGVPSDTIIPNTLF